MLGKQRVGNDFIKRELKQTTVVYSRLLFMSMWMQCIYGQHVSQKKIIIIEVNTYISCGGVIVLDIYLLALKYKAAYAALEENILLNYVVSKTFLIS